MVLILVVTFAIGGLFRGLIAQVVGVAGVLLGVWTGAAIAQWVGVHWEGAQPAVIFWTLRWLVTLLGGLAVLSLFQVLSHAVGSAVRESPLGIVDRVVGLVGGAFLGLVVVSLLVMAIVMMPTPTWLRGGVAHTHWSRPLLEAASATCLKARAVPGSLALRRQFLTATRRLEHLSTTTL